MTNHEANFNRHKDAKHDGEQDDSCPTCIYMSGNFKIPPKEVDDNEQA